MESITLPSTLTIIENSAFSGDGALASITIPSSVISIGNSAFVSCHSLASVIISADSQLQSIGSEAFSETQLSSFVLPNSINQIGSKIFYCCSTIDAVYYNGTAEEWSAVNGCGNISETVYFYSESRPTTDGNYWHYDDNQNITKW
jgi:hypothetical protein